MKRFIVAPVSLVFFILNLSGAPAAAQLASDPMPDDEPWPAQGEEGLQPSGGATQMFDTDRGLVLVDTDGDGFPDLTEAVEGTNPLDPDSFPGSDLPEVAEDEADFPAVSCRPGFRQIGTRLCISLNVHDARTYANAETFCRDRSSKLATYGDLRYLYVRSSFDAAYNPNGRWIGNIVGDDTVLCGNRAITFDNDPDIGNFEGECNRFGSRNFWCAHDRN